VTAPLTVAQANAVYDILVKHAGASDALIGESRDAPVPPRAEFVFQQTRQYCAEYRSQGELGFGGKFWHYRDRWYVTAYPEHVKTRPELQDRIDATNTALSALRQSVRS
jgi:hypothetical protein